VGFERVIINIKFLKHRQAHSNTKISYDMIVINNIIIV
jgi:hypothetical protein